MRKQTNRNLLLGCAFGVQLLYATNGYSEKTGYTDVKPVNSSSSPQLLNASKSGRNKNMTAVQHETSSGRVQETISGRVTGPDGKPVSGVSVQVKGSKGGVLTGADGSFSITAATGDVLIFSSVGFDTKEVKVTGGKVNVSLLLSSAQLTEVVVTALGIQRNAKSLTYSAQKVSNNELTTVKDLNFINSLSGKVAGVTITKSASGVGGSSRVILRGNKSTRVNDPLYVIDGIPLQN